MYNKSTPGPTSFCVLGMQALLDIRFPDVSQHGQGLHLMSYDDPRRPWRKLTLWHAIKPCEFHLPNDAACEILDRSVGAASFAPWL